MSERTSTRHLGDLAFLRTEKVVGAKDPKKRYVGLEHMASGEPFLLGTARSDSSISTNSVFYRGDVLFGKLRPNLRKCLLAPFDGYCSTDILVLQPNGGFSPDFVAHVFQRDEVFEEAVRTAEGTKMPRTSWARLKEYEVFAPDVDAERAAIAAILNAANEAIVKTETLIAKLKAVKQGLLNDLLTRGLDDNGQLRDPEKHPEQFKDFPLGRMPKDWNCVTLKDVADTFAGGTPPRNASGMFGGTIPWVKSTEVNLREIASPEESLTERGLRSCSAKWVNAGTPLVAMYGATAGIVGWLAIRAVTNQAVLAVVSHHAEISSRWLYWVLSSRQGRLVAAIQGSGQPNLSKGIVDGVMIPLPEDSKERNEIVSILDNHDNRIIAEAACLSKLKAIKKGLMQDLLTGRVRVPEAMLEETRAAV